MQKLVAITFSFLILLQSVNIGMEDVSKLRILFEHANYHQETYGDSFFDFIVEHYGDEAISHNKEHEEHERLPFKHNNHTCAHSSVAFTFQPLNFNLEFQPFIEIPFNFFYKESTSLFEKPSIFQPPKFA